MPLEHFLYHNGKKFKVADGRTFYDENYVKCKNFMLTGSDVPPPPPRQQGACRCAAQHGARARLRMDPVCGLLTGARPSCLWQGTVSQHSRGGAVAVVRTGGRGVAERARQACRGSSG